MSLSYRKIPQCRVCKSKVGDQIDTLLLRREQYQVIIDKFGAQFPPDGPLTKVSLRNHNKHLSDAIELAASVQRAATPNVPALAPQNAPQSPASQRVFSAAVRDKINEAEVLEQLVASGLDDLKQLAPSPDIGKVDPTTGKVIKEGEFDFAKRDRVRKTTGNLALASAQVKQLQLQADTDRHRLELGRVAFRMFELVRRALEVCPDEFRTLIATTLKDNIRNDDEISELLREQATRSVVPPTAPGQPAATVNGVAVSVTEASE